MSFIIEISSISASKHRFLTTKQDGCTIYRDKCGVPEISEDPFSELFMFRVKKLTDNLFEVIKSDLTVMSCNLNCSLQIDEYCFRIFQISKQAEMLSKLNRPELLGQHYCYSLECPTLDIDIGLYPDMLISVGSSEFDSLTLQAEGLKPRHFEIQLKDSLQTSEILACVGQVKDVNANGNRITFKAGAIEFVLSAAQK